MRATRVLRALLGGFALLAVLAITGVRPRGRRDRLEPGRCRGAAVARHGHAPGRRPGGCLDGAPGDGPRRCLRRGQRDRRMPRAVRLLTRGQALVLAGRRRRGRGASCARQRRARDPRRPHARDRGRLSGDAPCRSRMDRRRPAGSRRAKPPTSELLAARAGDGRFGGVPLRRVDPVGRLAGPGAAGDRDRPGSLAGGRHTVRAPRRRSIPRPRTPPPRLAGVRRRLQRGEGDGPGDRLDPDARPDGGGRVLGHDQRDRDDGEHHPLGSRTARAAPWPTTPDCSRACTRTPQTR